MNSYNKNEPQTWGSLVLEYRVKDWFKPDTDLFIVNVNKPYLDNLNMDAIEKLTEYCTEFPRVFQILDIKYGKSPSFTFPSQIGVLEVNYGGCPPTDSLASMLQPATRMRYNANKKSGHKPGEMYTDMYGWVLLYVGHEKEWMYCNPKLVKTFTDIVKLNRKAVFVGGELDTEMKEIVLLAKTLDVQTMVNFDLSYSEKK
jgi:hypothetical protein